MIKTKLKSRRIIHETNDEYTEDKHHFDSNQELRRRIEKKAYELYESRGCAPGRDWDDWLEAEKLVEAELAANPY